MNHLLSATSIARYVVAIAMLCLAAGSHAHELQRLQVASPDQSLLLTVEHNTRQGTVSYSVARDSLALVDSTALGLVTDEGDLTRGLAVSGHYRSSIDEEYRMIGRKKRVYQSKANLLAMKFVKGTQRFSIEFRVFDDGFAYRYTFPDQGSVTIRQEAGGFRIHEFVTSWTQEFSYTESGVGHENPYDRRDWNEISGICFNPPLLVTCRDSGQNVHYILLSEAQNEGSYAGAKLCGGAQVGEFFVAPFSEQTEILSATPMSTPWRMAICARNLGEIVENTLTENLNPPSEIIDWSWVKPGRAAWNWGASRGVKEELLTNWEKQKEMIQFASSMGWEYFMLDYNWWALNENGRPVTVEEVARYATRQGVGILLWADINWFTNSGDGEINFFLQQVKRWGVAGVKFDYFNSESQATMQVQDKLLQMTAAHQLMINFHAFPKPSGLQRKWPHLLTQEAVRGSEYIFANEPLYAPSVEHMCTLPFTRNAVGPMDFTPVEYENDLGMTTWGFQTALSIIYHSFLQHYVNDIAWYASSIAKPLLRELPVVWDETRLISGSPGEYVLMGRRNVRDWYFGAITKRPRKIEVPLSQLQPGVQYYAYIYKDAPGRTRELVVSERSVAFDSPPLQVSLPANGGAAIWLTPRPLPPQLDIHREGETAVLGGGAAAIDCSICSGGRKVSLGGNTGYAEFDKIDVPFSGKYNVYIYYSSKESAELDIRINGKPAVENVQIPAAESTELTSLVCIPLDLGQGGQRLRFSVSAPEPAPEIDKIVIVPARSTRRFHMGVNSHAFDWGAAAEEVNWEITNQLGDIAGISYGNGIPWDDIKAAVAKDQPLTRWTFNRFVNETLDRDAAKRDPGKKVFLSVGSLSMLSRGVCGNWPESAAGVQDLTFTYHPDWSERPWSDPELIDIYIRWSLYLIDRMKPDYFCYVPEGVSLAAYEEFESFKIFARAVYNGIKAMHPDLPVMYSVSMPEPESAVTGLYEARLPEIDDATDIVGVGIHPFFFGQNEHGNRLENGDPWTLPTDWLTQLRRVSRNKPLAITSVSWPASVMELDLDDIDPENPPFVICGTPGRQRDFLSRFLLPGANAMDVEFLLWFSPVDYDAKWQGMHDSVKTLWLAWRDGGLFDEEFRERPALYEWLDWYNRPKE